MLDYLMFQSRKSNNRLNETHERALPSRFNVESTRLIYAISMTIHNRNLRSLATEIYMLKTILPLRI